MNKEFRIQRAIMDHLDGVIRKGNTLYPGTKPFRGIFPFHVFQGRSEEEGFFLKMLGVKAGVLDIPVIWESHRRKELEEIGRKHNIYIPPYELRFMEVKTKEGTLTSSQRKFTPILNSMGIVWEIVRSVRDAHNLMIRWGHTPQHNAIVEPDLRTDDEKQKDADKAMWGVQKYLTTEDMRNGRINPDWKP